MLERLLCFGKKKYLQGTQATVFFFNMQEGTIGGTYKVGSADLNDPPHRAILLFVDFAVANPDQNAASSARQPCSPSLGAAHHENKIVCSSHSNAVSYLPPNLLNLSRSARGSLGGDFSASPSWSPSPPLLLPLSLSCRSLADSTSETCWPSQGGDFSTPCRPTASDADV